MERCIQIQTSVKYKMTTENQKADFQEAFTIFDKDEDGKINAKELGFVMRAMGHNLCETELRDIIKDVDADEDGAINISEFLMITPRYIKETNAEEELRQAFAVFDNEQKGFLDVEDLRRYMTNMGDKLSDEEVEEMLRHAPVDKDGRLYYHEFIKLMLAKNEGVCAQPVPTL